MSKTKLTKPISTIPIQDVTDVYCPLPFNHMNLHPNGHVGLCCVSEMFPPNDGFYRDRDTKEMLNLSNDSVKNKAFEAKPLISKTPSGCMYTLLETLAM